MIIAITEYNAWENERWTVGLELTAQRAESINDLYIFIKFANEEFDRMKANAGRGGLFAASRYFIKFYDDYEKTSDGRFVLKNHSGGGLHLGNRSYKSSYVDTGLVISPKKMRSAMLRMRDKSENILYKSLENVFLKKVGKKTKNELFVNPE